MTIKEIYEWAKQNGVQDADAAVQYRDGGGYYSGVDEDIYCSIEEHYGRKNYGGFMKVYKNLEELTNAYRSKIYSGDVAIDLPESAVLVAIRSFARVYKTIDGQYIVDPFAKDFYMIKCDDKKNKERIVAVTDDANRANSIAAQWHGHIVPYVDDGNFYWRVIFLRFGGVSVIPTTNHDFSEEDMEFDRYGKSVIVAAHNMQEAISIAMDKAITECPEVLS